MMSNLRRLHPASIAIRLTLLINQIFLPVAVIIIIKLDEISSELFVWIIMGGIFILIIVCFLSFLSWYRFLYGVIDGEFRIESGIFIKEAHSIPIERIQSIRHEEAILHRLFKVTHIQVKTASSLEKSLVLTAVSKTEASSLQNLLTSDKKGPDPLPTDSKETESKPISFIPFKKLVIISLSSGSLFLIIPFLGSVFSFLEYFTPTEKIFRLFIDNIMSEKNISSLILIICAVFLLSIVLSLAGSILKYRNFTVSKTTNHLVIKRGILKRQQFNVPVRRIQALQIKENLIRQLLGYSTIRIIYLGSGEELNKSLILHPLVHVRELKNFMNTVIPEYSAGEMKFQRIPPRSWHFFVTLDLILNILVASTITFLIFPWGSLSLIVIPLFILYGYKSFKDEGWYLKGNLLVARSRFITRRTVIIPHNKIQSSALQQNYLQRLCKLMHLELSVAGGTIGKTFAIKYLDQEIAKQLLDWVSYKSIRRSSR